MATTRLEGFFLPPKAAEPKTNQLAVKMLADAGESFTVGGYGVVWNGQDIVGDYFTPSTDFWFDRLTETPMCLYQHGRDGTLKRAVVGKVTAKRSDDTGLWVEAQITAAKEYADAIRDLVKKGVLGWSAGAVAHLVDRVKGVKAGLAEITSWPIAEFSLTPTPCEPRTIGVTELKAMPELEELVERAEKAKLDAAARDNLSAADFAYIDSDGERHLPINDAEHVRAALARFDQTQFDNDAAKRKAARKILRAASRLGVDVSKDSVVSKTAGVSEAKDLSYEDIRQQITALLNPPLVLPGAGRVPWSYVVETYPTYAIVKTEGGDGDVDTFKIPYTIGDLDGDGDEDVVLGTPVEVEEVYVPVGKGEKKARHKPGEQVEEAKVGRTLSQRNLDQVHSAMKAMEAVHAAACQAKNCPMGGAQKSAEPEEVHDVLSEAEQILMRLELDDFTPSTPQGAV